MKNKCKHIQYYLIIVWLLLIPYCNIDAQNRVIKRSSTSISKQTVENRSSKTRSLQKAKSAQKSVTHKAAANELKDKTFTVKGVSFIMKVVKGGTYNRKDYYTTMYGDISLGNFYIGQTEVTQQLWVAVMGYNPSHFTGDNLPVESVSWDDCQTFISRLNDLTGQNFRLPTDEEWEFAARGGNKSHGYKYAGSNIINDVAWYPNNSNGKTHPVATKRPNELGIYDMSGNVDEWCQDWYKGVSYPSPCRIQRGGSWGCYSFDSCLVTYVGYDDPTHKLSITGMRLALDY